MDFKEISEKMKSIHETLLNYIDHEGPSEDNFENLKIIFEDPHTQENKYALISIFHLITKISTNHYRGSSFFDKIDKILKYLEYPMKKYFSQREIFNIFKSNKRILLFLVEESIITFDRYIVSKITKEYKYVKAFYPQFFQPELQPFINEKWFPTRKTVFFALKDDYEYLNAIRKDLPDNFYENRKRGENHNYICELIRRDAVEEFVAYVTKTNYSLDATIEESIYETHSFLINKQKSKNVAKIFVPLRPKKYDNSKEMTLIKYAAFFGSIQIFRFLKNNGISLTSFIWPYVIHSNNADIFHILEECHVQPEYSEDGNTFNQYYIEAIKCHHNDFAKYIKETYSLFANAKKYFLNMIKYHNYDLIDFDSFDKSMFFYFCRYGYTSIVSEFLKSKDIDVNILIVSLISFYAIHLFGLFFYLISDLNN